jgi:hypothetical protein
MVLAYVWHLARTLLLHPNMAEGITRRACLPERVQFYNKVTFEITHSPINPSIHVWINSLMSVEFL